MHLAFYPKRIVLYVRCVLTWQKCTPSGSSNDARRLIVNVYLHVAMALVVAAVGMWINLRSFVHPDLLAFLVLLSFGLVVALALVPRTPNTLRQRTVIYFSFAMTMGLILGPLHSHLLDSDPAIVYTAAGGAIAVFASFTALALQSDRRWFLYAGGSLSSALMVLLILGISNSYFDVPFITSLRLYGGFLLFCAYVVFDTQVMIYEAEKGKTDPIHRATCFFLDFLGLYIRILEFLTKLKTEEARASRPPTGYADGA